ncbi:hypothetical protein ACHAWF_006445 [Thalassiosira exigua]
MRRALGANTFLFTRNTKIFLAGLAIGVVPMSVLTIYQTNHQLSNLLIRYGGDNDHPAMQLQHQQSKAGADHTHAAAIDHRMKPFCHYWDRSVANNRTLQPFDIWFTHHPTWVVTSETDEKFCVEPGNIKEHPYIHGMLQFYANQFHSSCSALICEEGDTTCYFLPYHDCGTSSSQYWREKQEDHQVKLVEGKEFELPEGSRINEELGQHAYLFMTRKLLWLRRAVFDYKQNFKKSKNITEGPNSDCTVVHVRRADVVLHKSHTRRYFPVADYVKLIPPEKLSNPNHHIFFLTDDANAIEEAHEFFPSLNWKYFDRPRHKGSEGGWENQTPSRNPALEVIVLLATFELAQECSAMVYGHSNFAEYIYQQMNFARLDVERYRVDADQAVYNPLHNTSEADLEKALKDMRSSSNRTEILSMKKAP